MTVKIYKQDQNIIKEGEAFTFNATNQAKIAEELKKNPPEEIKTEKQF